MASLTGAIPFSPIVQLIGLQNAVSALLPHRASQAEHKTVPLHSPYNPNNLPYSIFSHRHSFRKKYPPLEPGLNPALQLPAVNVKADSWLKIVVSEARDTEFS